MHPRDVPNEILCCNVVREIVVFWAVANKLAKFGARVGWILAEYPQRPTVGVVQSEQHSEKCGLARSVRPEQPGHSLGDLGGQVGEYLVVTPGLRHGNRRDDRWRGGRHLGSCGVHRDHAATSATERL
jgi:hypothetical protein